MKNSFADLKTEEEEKPIKSRGILKKSKISPKDIENQKTSTSIGGRPTKPEKEKLNKRITIYFTPDEEAHILEKIGLVKASAHIRNHLIETGYIPKPKK